MFRKMWKGWAPRDEKSPASAGIEAIETEVAKRGREKSWAKWFLIWTPKMSPFGSNIPSPNSFASSKATKTRLR